MQRCKGIESTLSPLNDYQQPKYTYTLQQKDAPLRNILYRDTMSEPPEETSTRLNNY